MFAWVFLTILGLFLGISYGYMYYRDRDKRKLMFMIAFLFAAPSFLLELETGLEQIQVLGNFFASSVLPMMCAISIAVFSSLLKLKNFDKPFKIFLFTLVGSVFLIFAPLPLMSLSTMVFQSISIIVIVVSGYLYLARRETSDLVFLLAMICFTSGGVGMAFNLDVPFITFAYSVAFVLIALVFMTSKENPTGGIASFFSLKNELKKTRQKLEISQDKLTRAKTNFKSLVNLIADPVVILDHKGNFLEINDKVAELTGFTAEDLIGKNFIETELIAGNSKTSIMKNLANRMTGLVTKPYEIEINTKSGITMYLEINAKKIEYEGKSADLVVLRDITERKMMEEKLVKSERLAAIGEAATMVGHDLRNPLQAIENGVYYLSTLLSDSPVPKKILETLQAINTSIDYADNIVKDLQNFASNRTPLFKDTDINMIVKDVLSNNKKQKNIELVMELGQLPKIEADKEMMKRVLVNLTTNGIQAMEEKGGTLTVSTKKTGDAVDITFKDTGTGIKKENLNKIFTPFFTTKAQGMGIGLTITRRFVELHNGSITVESEEGEGAKFTVNLPITKNGDRKVD